MFLYLLGVRWGLPGLHCPIESGLGLECPGCGITRAGLALLRLDPIAAVRWNPLVVFVAPFAVWKIFESGFVLAKNRAPNLAWPRWWVRGTQLAFVLVWLVLAGIRAGVRISA